jgi:hypothetical protein
MEPIFKTSRIDFIVEVVFILLLYIALFWAVFGLWAYHLYLVVSNQTTREKLKNAFKGKAKNPWDKGCWKNCEEFYSGSKINKWFDLRKKVDGELFFIKECLSFEALACKPEEQCDSKAPRVNVSIQDSLNFES